MYMIICSLLLLVVVLIRYSQWIRTGKWGRDKATDAAANAKENLEAKKVELQQQVKVLKKPLAPDFTYGL